MENIKGFICDLADIVNEKNLAEIETVIDGDKIRITKNMQSSIPSTPSTPSTHSGGPAQETPVAATQVEDPKKIYVKAPIVGTFYSKPSPDAKQYATKGTQVKKGDVIFIIEAMKNMNEITSAYDAKVCEILVKDGQLVEYGQDIMILE